MHTPIPTRPAAPASTETESVAGEEDPGAALDSPAPTPDPVGPSADDPPRERTAP